MRDRKRNKGRLRCHLQTRQKPRGSEKEEHITNWNKVAGGVAIIGTIGTLLLKIINDIEIHGFIECFVIATLLIIIFVGFWIMISGLIEKPKFDVIGGDKLKRMKQKKRLYGDVKNYIKQRYVKEFRELYLDPMNQAGGVSSKLFRLDDETKDKFIEIGELDAGDEQLINDLSKLYTDTEVIMESNRRIEQSYRLNPLRQQIINKLDFKLLHIDENYGGNESNGDKIYRYMYVETIRSGHHNLTAGTSGDLRWFPVDKIVSDCNLTVEEVNEACTHHPEMRKQTATDYSSPALNATIDKWAIRKFVDDFGGEKNN